MDGAPTTALANPAILPPRPWIAHWRAELARGRSALKEAFYAKPDTPALLREHARLVDRVVRGIWAELAMPAHFALLAVGGFGRGQLFPQSDVDLLILLPADPDPAATAAVEHFFAAVWDVGLEVAHAVRTLAECETEMADVTIRTSLLERRLLAGSRRLYDQFRRRFAETLDIHAFYAAKMLEQQQRHIKYHDAAYNLEPIVKESPGGLRDLQTVLWIARAADLGKTWRELTQIGLMTAD